MSDAVLEPPRRPMSQRCPSCDFEWPDPFDECPRCGILVDRHLEASRLGARADGLYRGTPTGEDERRVLDTVPASLPGASRRAILIGSGIALGLYLFPFTRFVFSYLLILIHELGHSATSWLLGVPAIPALDFVYGGGVSIQFESSAVLVVLLFGLWAAGLFLSRHRPRLAVTVAAGLGLYVLAISTPLKELLTVSMGHGAELLFATIFCYRAISGAALRSEAERPAYAFCGAFITLSSVHFAARLLSSAIFRREYEQAKGGGHWMDFSRIAEGFLGVDLSLVAGMFFLAAFCPPLVALLLHLNRERVRKSTVWLCRSARPAAQR